MDGPKEEPIYVKSKSATTVSEIEAIETSCDTAFQTTMFCQFRTALAYTLRH